MNRPTRTLKPYYSALWKINMDGIQVTEFKDKEESTDAARIIAQFGREGWGMEIMG